MDTEYTTCHIVRGRDDVSGWEDQIDGICNQLQCVDLPPYFYGSVHLRWPSVCPLVQVFIKCSATNRFSRRYYDLKGEFPLAECCDFIRQFIVAQQELM